MIKRLAQMMIYGFPEGGQRPPWPRRMPDAGACGGGAGYETATGSSSMGAMERRIPLMNCSPSGVSEPDAARDSIASAVWPRQCANRAVAVSAAGPTVACRRGPPEVGDRNMGVGALQQALQRPHVVAPWRVIKPLVGRVIQVVKVEHST